MIACLRYWGIGLDPPREPAPQGEDRKKGTVEKALHRCRRLAKKVRRTEEQLSRTLYLWSAPLAPEPLSPPKKEVALLGREPAVPKESRVGNGADPRPPRTVPSYRGRREIR